MPSDKIKTPNLWTFGINTFVHPEKLAVFLDCKGMGTMGTA